MILGEFWNNREAIATLDIVLPQQVADAAAVWDDRSLTYQREYRLVDKTAIIDHRSRKRAEEEKQKQRQNKKLLAAVKAAKAAHDRCVKRLDAWNNLKKKYLKI